MKVRKFAESVYLPNVRKSVRDNTYEGYKSSYFKHIKPFFGEVELNDIDLRLMESWLETFQSAGSQRKAYSTFRQIIRKAQDYGYFTSKDPTKCSVKLKRTEGNTHKILNSSEVRQLVSGFKGHPLEANVVLSVFLGLRRCESLGLTWGDISLDTGKVHVRRSRQYVGGKEVVYPPKTKKSARTCYLPKEAVDILKECKPNGASDSDWVCPIPVNKVGSEYKSHCLKNNLPYTPMMNLRHTFATLQVEQGVDVLIVANMLGHTDVSMAYERYVKPREQTYVTAQSSLGSMVLGKKVAILDKIKSKLLSLLS